MKFLLVALMVALVVAVLLARRGGPHVTQIDRTREIDEDDREDRDA